MISDTLKTAFRNLRKHKSFVFLNVAGLTLGLSACLLIALFIRNEYASDRFISKSDRIYRAYYKIEGPEGNTLAATTPPTFPNALQQNFPEVEGTLRLLSLKSKSLFGSGSKKIYEEGGLIADSNFFSFFPLPFVYGSGAGITSDPNAIAISLPLSQKLFGTDNPVGKEISIGKGRFTVKGVFKRDPNFHLAVNFVLPLSSQKIPADRLSDWGWYGFYNYVMVRQGTDMKRLEKKFQVYTDAILNKDGKTRFTPFFQKLTDIHLFSSDFDYDIAKRGNIVYVEALAAIALFMLVIACFNFVNLSTARSLKRAREVGVRKAIGASRKNLVLQFMTETFLLVTLSVYFSAGITYLVLPYLNAFTEKQIQFDLFTSWFGYGTTFSLIILVSALAGLYPSLVLASYRPASVLKGSVEKSAGGNGTATIRKVLVVIQFSLSSLLIISSLVVISQVRYLHSKSLGFNKEQIMFFPMRGDKMGESYEVFKQELVKSPAIVSASIGYGFPGDIWGDGVVTVPGSPEPKKVNLMMIDHDYIRTLGLKLVAGTGFSKENRSNDGGFILNEAAVGELGFASPAEAIGKEISWPTWKKQDSLKRGRVIGVVKDYNYKSLHDKIEPAVLQIYPDSYWKVAVKIRDGKIDEAVQHVRSVWNSFAPDYPIEYRFLDDAFYEMYQTEDKLMSLISTFTLVTILIACFGLFGLAAFEAERRKKEIGIRKVLGATVQNIVLLLSKRFLALVFVAVLIASPLAWLVMGRWLQNFSYRIEMGWWIFIIAASGAVVLAFLTIAFHAFRSGLLRAGKEFAV